MSIEGRNISNVYIYSRIDYLLREEGRRRVRVEVPREESVDQLGLQAASTFISRKELVSDQITLPGISWSAISCRLLP